MNQLLDIQIRGVSAIIRVDLNSDEYIRMYPYLKDLLEELFSTSIEDTIEEIEDERKIKVPNLIKFNYTGLVNNRQKTIKRTW